MSWSRVFETTWTVSERLDYTIYELDKLQAKFDALVQLLADRGGLTQDEIGRIGDAGNTIKKPS
jgi:hypothetical protein